MSYTPTLWYDGDIITADKLNNIEKGILDIEANINTNFSMGPYGVPLSVYNLVVPIQTDQYTRMLMTHPLSIRAAITKITEQHKSNIDELDDRVSDMLDDGTSIAEINEELTITLVAEAGYSWKPNGTKPKLLLYRLSKKGEATLIDDEETDEILSEETLNELTDVFVMKFFTNDDIYNLETIKIGNSPTDYKIYYPIPNGTIASREGTVFDMVLAPSESYSRGPSYIVFAETTMDFDDVPSITAFIEYSDYLNVQ